MKLTDMSLSLGIKANKEKIGVLLAYIAFHTENINLRKLLKLVFLIDESYVTEKGYPLTWLDYYVWKKGPVAVDVYKIKNNTESIFNDYVYSVKSENGKYIIKPTNNFSFDKGLMQFSENQISFIDNILSKYGALSADELSDITHQENTLWSKAVKDNSIDFSNTEIGCTDIKLNLKDLLDKDNIDIYEDAFECAMFEAELNN